MTISSTTSRVSYNGNGVTTIFAFPYRFFVDSDLQVDLVEADGTVVPQVLNTDFTVSGEDTDSSGQVTMVTPPASGEKLVIYRIIPLTQETDYLEGDPFPAESHERALDKLTLIVQQHDEALGRTLQVPVTSETDASTIDVEAVEIVAGIATDVTTVAVIDTEVTTVAGISADVTTVAGIAGDVTAVAGNAANINAVAANETNIDAVATNSANINTVATNSANINTVAGISANVTTVAGIAGDVSTVAADSADIQLLADNIGTISAKANAGANSDITSLSAVTRVPWVAGVNDFRLTLTTGVPVTTSDVTGATTVYCSPYKGRSIALYDGVNWNVRQSNEFSLALGTLTSGRPYDVFCYDNAGTPTLEFLAWTNDTTRATALAYQDGVLVKSGDATRRYLGTFYTTATTTTEDSAARRYLWNYYHRVPRKMVRRESTANWTYTTATVRQARADTNNQLNFVLGVAEDAVSASVNAAASNTDATGAIALVGVGVDSTTTVSSDCVIGESQVNNSRSLPVVAYIETLPAAGRHFLAWLEYSTATGTTTWLGTPAGRPTVTGIVGRVMA